MAGKTIFVILSLVAAASCYFPPNANPNDYSCDPEGHIFLLLPHYTDCTKFYMCVHGQEQIFSCPASTIFDFFQQTCAWPNLSKCVLRSYEDEGSGDEVNDNMIGRFVETAEQQGLDSVASVRPIAAVMSQFNGIINCNRADEAVKQVPYKGDCQRYWKCIGGSPQVAYCTDGLFFNPTTQQCDFEANSKCDPSLAEDELKNEFIVYK